MPFEFTEPEWRDFSKTERRIITLARQLGYEKKQIMSSLEIADSTYRVHIASIKRKMAVMRRKRNEEELQAFAAKTEARKEMYGDSPDGAHPLDGKDQIPVQEQPSTEPAPTLLNVSKPSA